jgi:hypothetical protein
LGVGIVARKAITKMARPSKTHPAINASINFGRVGRGMVVRPDIGVQRATRAQLLAIYWNDQLAVIERCMLNLLACRTGPGREFMVCTIASAIEKSAVNGRVFGQRLGGKAKVTRPRDMGTGLHGELESLLIQ